MFVNNLGLQNSVFNRYVSELRDKTIQKDSMRFRKNLERLGEIFAYEISKTFDYEEQEVTTPLGIAKCNLAKEKAVVGTILRAGLPLHQGILNYLDNSDNAFVSAYRKHHKDGTFEIAIEYLSAPSLENRTVILCDPMLATGKSLLLTHQALFKNGTPKHTHIVAVLASQDGVNYLKKNLGENTTLWVGAIDEELTAHAYIVPGLGDAGDLAYGSKL